MQNTDFETLAKTIRRRKTWKVLGSPDSPVAYSEETLRRCDQQVRDAIATAGWAPFHYDRGVEGIPEPWRVHFVDAPNCRRIASQFHDLFDDVKTSNKLPAMLAACGCLVLVNWLPQFRSVADAENAAESPRKQRQIDDEHLAATAAMVQNLLLLLTARGMGTYWSSGGQLGSRQMFERLGIKSQESLVAAVFVEYPDGSGNDVQRVPGKHRGRRSPSQRWSARVSF